MGDGDNSGPAIPAWQRAGQTERPEAPYNKQIESSEVQSSTGDDELANTLIPSSAEPASEVQAQQTGERASDADQLRARVRGFLEDPAVRNAPQEKKRAFFESKDIPKDMIDEVLSMPPGDLSTSEFHSYRKQAQNQTAAPPLQHTSRGPPIIMYPETLAEAHRPAPLITPNRIVNTAYVAGGLAALIYGASKYLVTPMSASLTEARHDFALHSQSKIDQMNERLEKLVSKVPEDKKEKRLEAEIEDTDSETSDPTELYHRDMGTQTSPPTSRRPSQSETNATAKKKDLVEYQSNGLAIIKEHLSDMLERSESVEAANKEREESLNKLRHYLDTVMYTSMNNISVWGGDENKENKQDDTIEELKKEIRGVKGVLLSAKRFPGVAAKAAT